MKDADYVNPFSLLFHGKSKSFLGARSGCIVLLVPAPARRGVKISQGG